MDANNEQVRSLCNTKVSVNIHSGMRVAVCQKAHTSNRYTACIVNMYPNLTSAVEPHIRGPTKNTWLGEAIGYVGWAS